MSENDIEEAINAHIFRCGGDRCEWVIGITNDVNRRKEEHLRDHPNLKFWNYWKAYSKEIAETVEAWGLNAGMNGGTGGGKQHSVYVYIFKSDVYSSFNWRG